MDDKQFRVKNEEESNICALRESLDPRGPKNVGFRRSKKNVLCLAIEMYIRVLMHDVV